MKIELRYFTGTGNSLKVLKTCKKVFTLAGILTNIAKLDKKETVLPECDLIGFCFPVYAFAIPRICSIYLKALKRYEQQQNVFILLTAGDKNESGMAISECKSILRKKNCFVKYSGIVEMPINWTTSPHPPYPPTKEEAASIINKGVQQTIKIATDILNGIQKQHQFDYPPRYSKFKFYWDYYLFKYIGIKYMWQQFEVYNTCNGCQLCARICPTNSISIVANKPVWKNTCEQCMRCVNLCPAESIYQSNGGGTREKNKYCEPDFNPRKEIN